MIRAVLFDLGGTLDGEGHWLDRFWNLYARFSVPVDRETVRAAFDTAERNAARDAAMSTAGLDEMVARHVDWQLDRLGLAFDAALRSRLIAEFVGPIRDAGVRNTELLSNLSGRGLRLGVVSNGCGNVDALCRELGFAPFLTIVLDSHRVGISKPDPAIFLEAAGRLQLPPGVIMMVGDSFERDVRPARAVGMKSAWIGSESACPDPSSVDLCLDTLADLPAALRARELMPA